MSAPPPPTPPSWPPAQTSAPQVGVAQQTQQAQLDPAHFGMMVQQQAAMMQQMQQMHAALALATGSAAPPSVMQKPPAAPVPHMPHMPHMAAPLAPGAAGLPWLPTAVPPQPAAPAAQAAAFAAQAQAAAVQAATLGQPQSLQAAAHAGIKRARGGVPANELTRSMVFKRASPDVQPGRPLIKSCELYDHKFRFSISSPKINGTWSVSNVCCPHSR